MSETLPRWGLHEVNFLETDPAAIKSEIITGYEAVAGRALAAGDPIRLFLLAIAERIIHARNLFNIGAQQNLISYAGGGNLDALAELLAVLRLQASPALTTMQFTLSEAQAKDYIIPAGFEVTNGIVTFATDDDLTIPAGEMTGTALATCTVAGTIGNDYIAGQINTIVSPKPYIASAHNIATTSGGADIEGDPAFAERVRIATNSFSVAGPEAAYRYHVLSVNPVIIDAGLVAPKNEPCVVKIYPLTAGGNPATDEICSQVIEYFSAEDVIPLTDKVEVSPPQTHDYSINIDYYISSDDVSRIGVIEAGVKAAVENFRLWQQAKVGRSIKPDDLIYRVKAAGVAHVDLGTISPASYVSLNEDTVAQCPPERVTITYKGVM